MKVIYLCFFYLLFNSLAINANEQTSVPTISTIQQMAEDTIRKKIQLDDNAKLMITTQNLEGRLVPPRCFAPLIVELASEREIARNNTVKVSCNTPDYDYPWLIYISVRVEILYPVAVAAEVIAPGTLISAEQMQIDYIEQYSLRGQYFSDIDAVIGTRTKRRIAKGSPILGNQLCFVCKGDAVSIYAKTEHLQIKTLGEAMRDGNIGESIRVKNINSNKQLEATVIGIGEVEVRM